MRRIIVPAVRVGMLTPLVDVLPKARDKVQCRCDCGNVKAIPARALAHGETRSCGCLTRVRKDITGQRFGSWLVLRYAGRRETAGRPSLYECRCDCGSVVTVLRDGLVSNKSQSCGGRLTGGPRQPRSPWYGDPRYPAYANQRYRARKRGVEWSFTFDNWWQVWEASGKWGERGKRRHQFCMTRPGDVGPYSPTNVKIATNGDNLDEYYNRERATYGRIRPGVERRKAA